MKGQITLILKEAPSLPVEGDSIRPENFRGKSRSEMEQLPLLYGNRQRRVKDFFQIELDGPESGRDEKNGDLPKILIQGDLTRFKGMGRGMTEGEMEIHGSAGFHAGALMTGGSLLIRGNAGDWLGAHMSGGRITVTGSAGHFTGGAYRGKIQGMTGGTILIWGKAGQMAGTRMRRGLIAVGGDSGDAPGFKMLAGTLLLAGRAGIRTGANMKRGTIILFKETGLLPTFYANCQYQPVFWRLLHRELEKTGFPLPEVGRDAIFQRFSGDATEGGKGEVLLCRSC